jgi:membrane associated rhomboid family serine protease
MILIIPTGTDAPIYHWPYATVGLIAINIAAFLFVPPVVSVADPDDAEQEVQVEPSLYERYSLSLGQGLHPAQWVTHNFLHTGVFHLIGNMIFLWAFGIVAEGKLGVLKYLAAYLCIGTLHGALTQFLMLRTSMPGNAAGASAIIFGLLALCMVWAPRNELSCTAIILAGFRVFVFHWDVYYTSVALFYFGQQVVNLLLGGLTGSAVVSEMGHLSGAFWGTVIAVVMVKAGWVDCEGWDIFSLLVKRRELAKEWEKRGDRLDRQKESLKRSLKSEKAVREAAAKDERNPEERAASALKRVRKLIDSGDYDAAVAAYDKAARTLVRWPSQPDLIALIKTLHEKKAEAQSIPLMRDYCRYYPDKAAKVRLKLAHVLMRDRQRPTAALRTLGEIPAGSLPPDMEAVRRKLEQQALKMQEDGVLELEGDD